MPKRTNSFQRLIASIEAAVHIQDATIAESFELVDKITGEPREVDIVISLSRVSHPILISIECRGGGLDPRPATVEWVERMWGRHITLPSNKLVLVAKGGFTAAAQKKAAWLGIECLSLRDAQTCDWNAKIRALECIEVVQFMRPYPTGGTLLFPPDAQAAIEGGDINLEQPVVHAPDDTSYSVLELIEKWLTNPSLIESLEKQAFTDTGTVFRFERELKPGVYVVGKSGARYPVSAIAVEGKCHKRVETLHLNHATYGDALVAHGVTNFFDKELRVVVAERCDIQSIVTLSVSKKEKT